MKRILVTSFFFAILAAAFSDAVATERKHGSATSTASPLIFEYKNLDGNQINSTISSEGPYIDYRKTNSSGLEWPKGSKKTAVFTAGVWLGGIHRATNQIRMSVMDYNTEYQPGPLLETFNTTTNSDVLPVGRALDGKYRLYKIDRVDFSGTTSNSDFYEWPGDLGAPYIDKNNNGRWDPGIDFPKLYGDQQIWSVVNDVSKSRHLNTSTSLPIGVEIQTLAFCYRDAGLLNNMMFLKWKIINKSDADYDSVYISMWSDTDLGDANDDKAACDTLLSLGFVYNGDNDDGTPQGYGSKPPACGFDFFEGPRVPGLPSDSAHFEEHWIRGYKNLPAASHVVYFNANASYLDPPLGSPNFPKSAYGYMKGLNGSTQQPYIDPTTGSPSRFVFSGDPVSGSGWLMEKSGLLPQDVRSMISAGPFTLAKGDTQEIVGGFVIAQGANNINSVTDLKASDALAQRVFDLNFATIPSVTAKATLQASTALVTVACDTKNSLAKSVNAVIKKYDGTVLTQIPLYDDGTHTDVSAGDKIFTDTLTLPAQNQAVVVDVSVTFSNNVTDDWPAMASVTTTRLQSSLQTILSDNLNKDGSANPGENVRFNFTLMNTYAFGFTNITVEASTPNSSKSIVVPVLSATSQYTPTYDPNNAGSYLEFTVPRGYTAADIQVNLRLSDEAGNRWSDSLTFSVIPFLQRNAVLLHLRGHTGATPSIVVTDLAQIKNKNYVIFGVDSADINRNRGYSLKDSSAGSLLLQNVPLTPSELMGHISPPVDGFKVNWTAGYYSDVILQSVRVSIIDSLNFPWISYGSPIGGYFAFPGKKFEGTGSGSNVPDAEYRDISVQLSARTGFTDLNSNGLYDLGEPYRCDSLNTARSQRAYFYRKENAIVPYHYVGYFYVPMAVFDIESNPPRQLSLVVTDNDRNNQWDVDRQGSSATKNYIYVMRDAYDPQGQTYDSTKGGIDLSNALTLKLPLPSYWALWMMHDGIHSPYGGAGSYRIYATRPWTSADAFLFNPSIYTGARADQTATTYSLDQNYPNPFNPATMIRFSLPLPSHVTLTVYNILGQRVKALVDERKDAGSHEILWEGRNELGQRVASGVYFYRIQAGSFTSAKKMVMLK